MRAIADTSLFIARETDRPMAARPPDELLVSVVTVAELRAGVLAARESVGRAARMATLRAAETLVPLPIDDAVAAAWASLRVGLRDAGRRMPVNDSWIAATALAHDLAVATKDADFDGAPGLTVIKL